VHFFDPAKARLGKQASLYADAALANVLAWLA
jgi:hypothetical protein